MDSKRNVNGITIRPMINIDAFAAAQNDFMIGVTLLFITSFFSIAGFIGLVYRWDAIKATLGL